VSDYNYKQRPASREYRENWERMFGTASRPEDVTSSAKPGLPTPVDGPGASSSCNDCGVCLCRELPVQDDGLGCFRGLANVLILYVALGVVGGLVYWAAR
jgi:hypothetical protein